MHPVAQIVLAFFAGAAILAAIIFTVCDITIDFNSDKKGDSKTTNNIQGGK